jgi:hypothetical protein
MTQFPSLRPASWDIQLGSFPASVLVTMDGRDSIVSHSSLETARTWEATFPALTYAQFKDILAHWEEKGTVYSFTFSTFSLPSYNTPTGYRWRYTSKPQITDRYENVITVACTFEARFYPGLTIQPAEALVLVTADPVAFSPTPAAPPAPTVSILGLSGGATADGWVEVSGIVAGAGWEYSVNGGSTWTTGQGSGFRAPEGAISAGQIQVRQTTAGGTSAITQNAAALVVAPQGSALIRITSLASGATATGTVTLPRLGLLVAISMTRAGWLTLYGSAAAAVADQLRPVTREPAKGTGVIADPRLEAAGTINLNPFESLRNEEAPVTEAYPWRFKNEGDSGDILITLTYVPL